jgi:hypothetical protein
MIGYTWQTKDWNSGARRDGRFQLIADKHVSLATDTPATIEELLEAVFTMQSFP